MNEKYTSNVEWPDGQKTSDQHGTREQAEAVCSFIWEKGFGGDRKIFPQRVWVEPVDRAHDILSDGRPVSIIWADSPEHAIEIFRSAHKTTAKVHHVASKLGLLTAVPRVQE